MSYKVSHRACPVCRRNHHDNTGDNLAVYDDGHEYCYRCGYYIPPTVTVAVVKNKLEGTMPSADNSSGCSDLPSDVGGELGIQAKTWLLKFGLTQEEMQKFWWSNTEQQLIYPVFDVAGNLVLWQARHFGEGSRQKYFTSGNVRNHLNILGDTGPLILVEDVVSAIKIARTYQAMPLFGSHISKELLIRLRNYVLSHTGPSCELGIWLDHDKLEDAVKYTNQARELGIKAFRISSHNDPKYYANFEINNFIALARSANAI